MAEFSFIEISYDPTTVSTAVVSDSLTALGFVHRSQHVNNVVGFWNLRACIVLLRADDSNMPAHITGIGFNGTVEDVKRTGSVLDTDSDFFCSYNGAGLRTYIVQEKQLQHTGNGLAASYSVVDSSSNDLTHLEYISGIKINCHNAEAIEHYIKLGFRYTDVSDNYGKLTCENNRFTIMLDKRVESCDVPTVICDTHDVFDATAYFLSAGIELKQFNHNVHQNFGDELNYKIRAYNCRAWGNERSYTIENFVEGTGHGIDIIFRQRNQYLHIHETTIESYYANEH